MPAPRVRDPEEGVKAEETWGALRQPGPCAVCSGCWTWSSLSASQGEWCGGSAPRQSVGSDINTQALLRVPVGLHPAGLKPGAHPALRPRTEPGGRDRDVSGFTEAERACLKKFLEQHPTGCSGWWAGHVAAFAPGGERRLPGVALRLPGKPAEGHAPYDLFDKNVRAGA